MEEKYNYILNGLKESLESIPHVHVKGDKASKFCPEIRFIRVDFIDEEDYPHGIKENSVYVEFEFDLLNNKVEIFQSGHIYLTDNDMSNSYLCMTGLKNLSKFFGQPWMRAFTNKDNQKTVDKLSAFAKKLLEVVKTYTDNVYPYKQGVIDIYPPQLKRA